MGMNSDSPPQLRGSTRLIRRFANLSASLLGGLDVIWGREAFHHARVLQPHGQGGPWHEAVAEKLGAGDLPGATVKSPLGGKGRFQLRVYGRTNAGLQQVLAMAK